jgi:hypothetical protein
MTDYLSEYPGEMIGSKASSWKKLIGKRVVYIRSGFNYEKIATIVSVVGKNVETKDGDWLWIPHILQAKSIQEKSSATT